MSYRIKTVASLTGISPTTLRAWERRYDLIEPRRTESGYRVYSDFDIATLTRVKRLVDRGLKAGEAIALVRRGMQEPGLDDLSADALPAFRRRLLHSLLEFDRRAAAEGYARLAAFSYERQVDEVLLPLLVELGTMWEQAECSIAQEHFASAFAREKLLAMLDALSGLPFPGPEVLCAGAPGELHEFGLLAAAIHLATRGWKVTYLGADLPIDQIAPIARRRRPALLCTSVVSSRSRAACVALAAALRAACPPQTIVVVGGAGLAPDLPRYPDRNLYFLRTLADLAFVAPVTVPAGAPLATRRGRPSDPERLGR